MMAFANANELAIEKTVFIVMKRPNSTCQKMMPLTVWPRFNTYNQFRVQNNFSAWP